MSWASPNLTAHFHLHLTILPSCREQPQRLRALPLHPYTSVCPSNNSTTIGWLALKSSTSSIYDNAMIDLPWINGSSTNTKITPGLACPEIAATQSRITTNNHG
jgi:hypothetical protein